MIIQIILLLILVALAFFVSEELVLMAVVAIVPFHFFIKECLYPLIGEGSLFAMWKELVLMVVLGKILWQIKQRKIKVNKYYPLWLVVIALFGIGILFLFAPNKMDALISVKSLAFPLVAFFIAAHLRFIHINQRIFTFVLSISAFLVFIIAHIEQLFMPVQFGHLYRIITQILPSGKILYTESAYTILAKNRMYGPFVGPNELGMYTALILLYFSYVLFALRNNWKNKVFLLVLLILGISTLMQTYSRASWALFLFAAFILFVFVVRRWKPIWQFGVYVIASVVGMVLISKDLPEIFMASITGKEASAGARKVTFEESGIKIFERPFGYGLGTVQYSSPNPRSFNTEIYWWLILGEIGILMGLLLLAVYILSIVKMFSYKRTERNIFTSVMPCFLIAAVCAGWASVILFDPIVQLVIWLFVGLGINLSLTKKTIWTSAPLL